VDFLLHATGGEGCPRTRSLPVRKESAQPARGKKQSLLASSGRIRTANLPNCEAHPDENTEWKRSRITKERYRNSKSEKAVQQADVPF